MAYGQRAASSSLSEVFVFLKVVFHPTLLVVEDNTSDNILC